MWILFSGERREKKGGLVYLMDKGKPVPGFIRMIGVEHRRMCKGERNNHLQCLLGKKGEREVSKCLLREKRGGNEKIQEHLGSFVCTGGEAIQNRETKERKKRFTGVAFHIERRYSLHWEKRKVLHYSTHGRGRGKGGEESTPRGDQLSATSKSSFSIRGKREGVEKSS